MGGINTTLCLNHCLYAIIIKTLYKARADYQIYNITAFAFFT
jgi:hypothetical protein